MAREELVAKILDGPHAGRSYIINTRMIKVGLNLGIVGGGAASYFYTEKLGEFYLFKWVENHGEE